MSADGQTRPSCYYRRLIWKEDAEAWYLLDASLGFLMFSAVFFVSFDDFLGFAYNFVVNLDSLEAVSRGLLCLC